MTITNLDNVKSKTTGKRVREYYFVDKSTGELIYYYIPAPSIVLYNKELSDGAFRLFGVLCDYDGSNGECYPSVGTLAADLGKSESQIRRLIKELVNQELVTIIEEAGRTNHYELERYGTRPKVACQTASLEKGATGPSPKFFQPHANLTSLPRAKMDDKLKESKLKDSVCRTVQNSSKDFGLLSLNSTDLTEQPENEHFEKEIALSNPSIIGDDAFPHFILETNSSTVEKPESSETVSSFTKSATLTFQANQNQNVATLLVDLTPEQLKVADLLVQAKIGLLDVQELALKNDLETVQEAIAVSQSPHINSPTGYIISALRRGYVQQFRGDYASRVKVGNDVTGQGNNQMSQTQITTQQLTKPSRSRLPVRRSNYITNVMADFSLALHDIEHTKSNQGQANRIYNESGLEEKKFVELMYEAKKRTQWSALATSSDFTEATNRGAYFFVVLKELVAEKQANTKSRLEISNDCADQAHQYV